jgi:hypothetical protein
MCITILFSLFSCNKPQQTSGKVMGLGLLTVNTQYAIPLYKNEKDQVPFDTLKFKRNKSGTTSFVSNIKLKPYLISAGDSDQEGKNHISTGLVPFPPDLKFCVTDTGGAYYRIITNEATGETFVIKKEQGNAYYTEEKMLDENSCSNCPGSKYNPRWYLYETWERYLKRAEYVTKQNLEIYDAPDGKVIFQNKDGAFIAFAVTEVKGEWIRIKEAPGRESDPDTIKTHQGWTKWREGTNRLIDIIERSYE